jgi:glycosyltransferase involved in cell wall biosynthesis
MDGGDGNATQPMALRQELDSLQSAYDELANDRRRLERQLSRLRTSRAYRFGKLGSLLLRPIVWALVLINRQVLRPRRPAPPADLLTGTNPDLQVVLKEPLPSRLEVGRGQSLLVAGWCSHPDGVEHVEVLQDEMPVASRLMGRCNHDAIDVPPWPPAGDRSFVARLTLPSASAGTKARVSVRTRLASGAECDHKLGEIELTSESRAVTEPVGGDLVAICMTTFDPPPDLFARQVESIRRQTHRNWLCLISDDGTPPERFGRLKQVIGDDPRFRIEQTEGRLGFYRNFERCLGRVPAEAAFVALADHDDEWHPDKLESLIAALDDESAVLAYADMRIVRPDGEVLAPTFWEQRPNNWTDFGSMILANTVTGAASLLRRRLLDFILPFPPNVGVSYHDHWIACVAMALGDLRFVDRPLHDYVQHGANVIGHAGCQPAEERRPWWWYVRHWLGTLSPQRLRKRVRLRFAHLRAVYYRETLRLQQLAVILLMRCGDRMSPAKRKVVRRVAAVDRSIAGLFWLVFRRVRRSRDETLGVGPHLAGSIVWARTLDLRTRVRDRLSEIFGRQKPVADVPNVHGVDRTLFLQKKLAPLRLDVDADAPRRVNVLLPSIDFRFVFGGYIAKLALADILNRAGDRVRLVMVEECHGRPVDWRQRCQAYPGLETLMDRVELSYCHDRAAPLVVHPDDAFVATTWWTAHVAHMAVRRLGRKRFVYLIQEYETFTSPMGTFAAMADESYGFPHSAVFSTELLRDFFQRRRLGVFAENAFGDQTAFRNTITDVRPPLAAEMAARRPRKLLVYARPEDHAARNMYEVALLGLARAIQANVFKDGWEFFGIGAGGTGGLVRLPRGQVLHLLPRHDQRQYGEILRGFDVGLALMYTPHPSLVPIEMASAGLVTVTNTYANKTAAALAEISTNLIAVPPTLDGVENGLCEAVARAENYEGRVRGARVDWPTNWNDSFDAEKVATVREMLWRRDGAAARAA